MNSIHCLVNPNLTCAEMLSLQEEVKLGLSARDGHIKYLETRVVQLEDLITSIIKVSMPTTVLDITIL